VSVRVRVVIHNESMRLVDFEIAIQDVVES
jgi:hypothetical protein